MAALPHLGTIQATLTIATWEHLTVGWWLWDVGVSKNWTEK